MNQRQEGRRSVAAKDAREILFVDPTVESAPALLNGLRSGVDCVRLPEGDDPIAAMALHLTGRRGVEVIHVLSHGVPGALVMSGRRIDASALAARPTLTAAIRDALSEDAEIVLYGCSVAAGREGAAFGGALSRRLARPGAAHRGVRAGRRPRPAVPVAARAGGHRGGGVGARPTCRAGHKKWIFKCLKFLRIIIIFFFIILLKIQKVVVI